ncbi:hypothetical protein FRB94_013477 [Tulasnella sp. JGI-2019a]|nr:hypothetical protein FRB94_013477 [Tulasnella sp. JGI-2019a]KAG9028961.1 hypothetical protein FRB95_005876 [Tulasnella sp. JGI-2019a]
MAFLLALFEDETTLPFGIMVACPYDSKCDHIKITTWGPNPDTGDSQNNGDEELRKSDAMTGDDICNLQ